jgi:hypothetical protein
MTAAMVSPDHANKLAPGVRFDRIAATIIGTIAILSAMIGVIHVERSMEATRAQFQASRLAADISARIAVNSIGTNLSYVSDEAVLMLQMEGADRALAGTMLDEAGAAAVGQAMVDATTLFKAALTATEATTGGAPADAYVASMLGMTSDDFIAELTAQGHQIDLAQAAGERDRDAVLGLSFLALAGVLTALAAVLRESRGGWLALRSAAGLIVGAALLGILAFI